MTGIYARPAPHDPDAFERAVDKLDGRPIDALGVTLREVAAWNA